MRVIVFYCFFLLIGLSAFSQQVPISRPQREQFLSQELSISIVKAHDLVDLLDKYSRQYEVAMGVDPKVRFKKLQQITKDRDNSLRHCLTSTQIETMSRLAVERNAGVIEKWKEHEQAQRNKEYAFRAPVKSGNGNSH